MSKLDRAKIEELLSYEGDNWLASSITGRELREALTLALEALSHTAPSGTDMVLVPREPTDAMIEAIIAIRDHGGSAVEIYRRALAAAPPATQPQGDR